MIATPTLETLVLPDEFPAAMPDTVEAFLALSGEPVESSLAAEQLDESEPAASEAAAAPEQGKRGLGWVRHLAPGTLALSALVAVQTRLAEWGWSGDGHGHEKLRLVGHAYSAGSKLLAMKGISLPELAVHETHALLDLPLASAHPQAAPQLVNVNYSTTLPEAAVSSQHIPAPDDSHDIYTVQPNDNLWDIAEAKEKELGLSQTSAHTTAVWHKMYADNKAVIGGDPHWIHPKQTFNLDGTDKLITDLKNHADTSGSTSNTNTNNPDVTVSNGDHPAPALVAGHPLPDHISHDASTDVITHGMSIEAALAHKGITDPINQREIIQQVEHDGGFPTGTVYYEPGDPLPRLRDNAGHRLSGDFVAHLNRAFRELLDEQDGVPKNRGGRVPSID
jgi:nucleoid-associated protein YgaU